MPNHNQIDPRKTFAPRYLPWLLGAAMLIVYLVTLNHSVTLLNVFQVAAVSGWIWQPQFFNPFIFLVTLPFHLLPTAAVPVALNLFSALCASAALVILARSVAILPHDRTAMERMRERSDFAFLTGRIAWIPPLVAVFFAGFQLGFWKHATSFTSESFELLWFAVIIWQLLEYRLDERESRLFVAAFLFGAGMTENWALVAFFPLFMVMIIWLRKWDFFNLHFLVTMTLCGLGGLLFLFLLPLVAKFTTDYHLPIWEMLKPNLHMDWVVIKSVQQSDIRHDLALMALTSLFPALVISIRWSATFGDSSRTGTMLVNYTMHIVNAVIFGVLLWATFDPPFSAAKLGQEVMPNLSALTFYYVAALCIGYFCGYALLIFGRMVPPSKRNPRPDQALPNSLLWLCPVIVAGTLTATVIAGGLLIYRNAPAIHAINGSSLMKYAQFATQNLPRGGAILLCDPDDQNQTIRVYLVEAALAREGRAQNYPVVDTLSLNWVPYHNYLHKRFPTVWPSMAATNIFDGISPLKIFNLLNGLSKSNTLCYLNPSFGYYFEEFYQEPDGLTYPLKLIPEGSLLPPALDTNLIAANESFWKDLLDSERPAIERALNPPDYSAKPGPIGWLLMHLHITAETDPGAIMAGTIYSRSLNYLGVQEQRMGRLDKAAEMFSDAFELNSNNVVAEKNLEFNNRLRAKDTKVLNISPITPDQFGKYHDWNEVMAANGPYDEPSFCFDNGANFMNAKLMHQAAVCFNRVRELVPDNLAARLFLAQSYLMCRLPDKAMAELHDPLTTPSRFALTDENSTDLDILAAGIYFQKNEDAAGAALLEKEVALHPNNDTLVLAAAQSLNMRGLYTNALRVIDRKLKHSNNDIQWLYGKGIVSLKIGAYDDAVKALTHFLELATNNPDALYNRGFANFQAGHLAAAKVDFQKLQSTYPSNFPVAYGLGEIAWRKHDTNEAIRNYKIFIATAPTNTAELKTVHEHLTQLEAE